MTYDWTMATDFGRVLYRVLHTRGIGSLLELVYKLQEKGYNYTVQYIKYQLHEDRTIDRDLTEALDYTLGLSGAELIDLALSCAKHRVYEPTSSS